MTIETEDDLKALKKTGWIVAHTLNEMLKRTEPGITTGELDQLGKSLLEKHGAVSAPLLTYNFPGHTCISINAEAAHGIPGDKIIKAGDVVNIDVSAEKDGYFADTGGTTVVPPSNYQKDKLLMASRYALYAAMKQTRAGMPLSEIGRSIQKVARQQGFKVIRNLCSHGIGRNLHEEPTEIPGYHEPREKRRLHEGQVITIEPFLSTKSKFVTEGLDGWTLLGKKGSLSAQFEHTLVITKNSPIILTVA